MSERRCFGCMRTTSQHYCEHCGWPADRQNDPHQLPVGTVLQGKYQIGRVLGQGGFGITYLGWDMNLDIRVCIKEFYPSATVNRDTTRSTVVNCNTTNMEGYYATCLERFLREGKALAKFRNVPQIVGIHDFFQLNNTAYMVMEFVSGVDLAKYIQKRGGRLPMDEILKILKPVMEALQLVHEAGIIHRDISPDNIMLEPREGAKLLDFGAVRNVEHPDAEKELTRATEAILKNGFAPMEQYVAKGSLGPWTDVYAMSATIYYCLTGRIPEDSPIRLMEGTELDWTGAQGLTERQKAVLEKGMEPRAKDRIASIRELMDALYAPEAAVPVAEPVPEKKPEKDPLKTEIVSEFKVQLPVEPPKPAPEPEKAPEPVPAITGSVREERSTVVTVASGTSATIKPSLSENKRKKLWIVIAAVFLLVAIPLSVFLILKKDEVPLGPENDLNAVQSTTQPNQDAHEEVVGSEDVESKGVIYVLGPTPDHGWTAQAGAYAAKKVDEINAAGTWKAVYMPASAGEEQVDQTNQIIANGDAAGVVFFALEDSAKAGQEALIAEGIPFISFDRIIEGPDRYAVLNVFGDNWQSGAGVAYWMQDQGMEPGDTLVVLHGDSGSVCARRQNGFEQFLRGEMMYYDEHTRCSYATATIWTQGQIDALCADYNVVCNWSADGAYEYLEQKLADIVTTAKRNGGELYIYCMDDELVFGVLKVLESNGLDAAVKADLERMEVYISSIGGMQELYDVMSDNASYAPVARKYFDDMMSVSFSPEMIVNAIGYMEDYLAGNWAYEVGCGKYETVWIVDRNNVNEYEGFVGHAR